MVVAPGTGEWSCTETAEPVDVESNGYRDRLQMTELRWRRDATELVAVYSTPNAPNEGVTAVSVRSPPGWSTRRSAIAADTGGLAIEIRESLSDPPVLAVKDGTSAWRPLLNPNPQLAGVAIGEVELYRWRDADGNDWDGALVKPPGFEKGRRYPLVIQLNGTEGINLS